MAEHQHPALRWLLERHWLIPLIVASVVVAVGSWAGTTLEATMKREIEEMLTSYLRSERTALTLWLKQQESRARAVATDEKVRKLVVRLIGRSSARPDNIELLTSAPEQGALRALVDVHLAGDAFIGFGVMDLSGRIVASDSDNHIGRRPLAAAGEYLAVAAAGRPIVTRPVLSAAPHGPGGEEVDDRPTMFAGAPVLDDDGNVIAFFWFRIPPEHDFTSYLAVGRYGDSGETYAFDANGLMISESRFVGDLARLGLLPVGASTAILNAQVRDPGGDPATGFVPETPLLARPLTRMAASAVTGESGVDVDGYRDYRGVLVVGAWDWLPEYGFGVATEIDVAEAFEARSVVRRAFGIILLLLVAASAAQFFTSRRISGLRRDVRRARKLGQYTLEEKLGEGGMGSVYKARHALLKRPTSVKLIRGDQASKAMVRRFEQEVQLTSQLTHPNTISIYDYGRTPEGVFYYAMEYLEGFTLHDLVAFAGPVREARLLYILRQVLGSLAEAHSIGLIHRDIKPGNIMLCERGGLHDFAKVLDFGLVKDIGEGSDAGLTAVGAVTGTPLFMSPEQIRTPGDLDGRSDLYSVGAVAYFLVTGHYVFTAPSTMEVFSHHLRDTPMPPTDRIDRPIDSDVEELILRSLSKDRNDRAADASEMLAQVEECARGLTDVWTAADAREWWRVNAGRIRPEPPPTDELEAMSAAPTMDVELAGRELSDS